jgi:PadR family transcriptional regulator, regulatory protein PadR
VLTLVILFFYYHYRFSMSKHDNKAHPRHTETDGRGIYSGLIRIHILYHACEEPIFGLGMIEELQRHGYRLSAGTLYPLLHGLERKGLLRSHTVRAGRWRRREYTATSAGHHLLKTARKRLRKLFGEILEIK